MYFSCIQEHNDDCHLQLATWEKYHFNLIMNEQMKCIQCKALLYINIKENVLMCKRCEFVSGVNDIIWKCIKCEGEFHSGVKIYNKYEYKPMVIAIKKGMIDKRKAAPMKLPCGHEGKDIRHKKECNGELYVTWLNERKMVLCSKCKSLTRYEKFIWICVECNRRFRDVKVCDEVGEVCVNRKGDGCGRNVMSNRSMSTAHTDSNKSERMVITKNILKSTLGIDVRESKRNLSINVSIDKNQSVNNPVIIKKSVDSENVFSFNAAKPKAKLVTSLHKDIPTHISAISQSDILSNHVNSTQLDILRTMQNKHFNTNRTKPTLSNSHKFHSVMMIPHLHCRDNAPFRIVQHNKSASISSNTSIPSFDLNKYEIISQIHQGHNSKVLCVKQSKTNNFYALKKDFLIKQSKDNLIHNITIQYKCGIQSQYIVTITALNETNDEVCTLQELGINNLSSEIAANRKMMKMYKEVEVIKMIYQITEGMIAINENGYTHFNIQPKNILLFNEDDKQFKLCDFDNIKCILNNMQYGISYKELTSTHFISPQRYAFAYLFNNKMVTNKELDLVKADVYSLGLVVLYVMMPNEDLTMLTKDLVSFDYIAKAKEGNYIRHKVNKYLSMQHNKNYRNGHGGNKHGYSENLVSLLTGMLHINESKRLSFKEIKQFIQRYYQ